MVTGYPHFRNPSKKISDAKSESSVTLSEFCFVFIEAGMPMMGSVSKGIAMKNKNLYQRNAQNRLRPIILIILWGGGVMADGIQDQAGEESNVKSAD